jgi:glycosyltransferase involved in cell wall biosynthesis
MRDITRESGDRFAESVSDENAGATRNDTATAQPLLSIVVKTLNEEKRIGPCLASVLEAVSPYAAQIIVADSRSDDATVETAAAFGVHVVRLAPSEPRGCGVGAQLGFQHATGKYVLVMDGDMQMNPAFLPAAIRALDDDPSLAGVSGIMVMDAPNMEYRLRQQRETGHLRPGIVDRLDGGGLYRRAAIDQVGYLTDRNMHSYEELDLALRLRAAGWRLRRIDVVSASHSGHVASSLALLRARWRNRYVDGQGEALRAAFPSARMQPLLRQFWLSFAVIAWWGCLALCLFFHLARGLPVAAAIAVTLLPFVVMSIKRRSIRLGSYSVLAWQVLAAGLIRGFLRPRRDPRKPVRSEIANAAGDFPLRMFPREGARPIPTA